MLILCGGTLSLQLVPRSLQVNQDRVVADLNPRAVAWRDDEPVVSTAFRVFAGGKGKSFTLDQYRCRKKKFSFSKKVCKVESRSFSSSIMSIFINDRNTSLGLGILFYPVHR